MKLTTSLALLLAVSCASAADTVATRPDAPVLKYQQPATQWSAEAGKPKPALEVKDFAKGRILILGDSITQNGLWVSQFETLLQGSQPKAKFDLISVGLSSETLSGLSEPGHAGGAFARPCLHERLKRALDKSKPQLVLACYGMNDGIYQPFDDSRFKAFQSGVESLAKACKTANAKLILITPPVFESAAPYEEVLCRYSRWELDHPPAGVAAVIDLHFPMAEAQKERRAANPAFRFTSDGIHPGELGHLVMARSVAAALGIATPGSPEEQLAKLQADPLFKLVHERRQLRSAAWLDAIGYKRDRNVAPGSGDLKSAETKAAKLQTQIDALRRQPLK